MAVFPGAAFCWSVGVVVAWPFSLEQVIVWPVFMPCCAGFPVFVKFVADFFVISCLISLSMGLHSAFRIYFRESRLSWLDSIHVEYLVVLSGIENDMKKIKLMEKQGHA
jgi:hypothetical protein